MYQVDILNLSCQRKDSPVNQDSLSAERLQDRSTYMHPDRECDLVMKGGITSGVLYPLAVCELAETYQLRSVGGTSAGAIAAAVTAAAEYGRRSNRKASGFDSLAGLPEWLATDDHLVNLFKPPQGTRRARSLLIGALQGTPKLWLTCRVVGQTWASRRWWIPTLAALPGAAIVTALALGSTDLVWLQAAALILAILIGVIGLVVGGVLAFVLHTAHAIEDNMYGLVSGSDAWDGSASLSDWLTDEIDRLAGIDQQNRHSLTFGDLWAGPGQEAANAMPEDPLINLEMQATSVTEGRSYRLPRDLGSSFSFDENEFRRLFPPRIVDYLMELAGEDRRGDGLVPLPDPARLPVVVATRMSLSFPLLVSAVPLYEIDRSMQTGEPERCWFSDGGITSNFPVSYFDALLPSRPTFGINLRAFHPRHPQREDERRNIWMPRSNRSGVIEWWTRWPSGRGLAGVVAFLRAVADTMQNWVDNTQTRVPGYRDRIVHISHSKEEGGMNLSMPPDTLAKLSERGRWAGRRLVDYYTNPPGAPVPDDALATDPEDRVVSWENHRWIRLRTSLALVSDTLRSYAVQLSPGYEGELSAPLEAAPSYRFANSRQRRLAQALMHGSSSDEDGSVTRLPAGLIDLVEAMAEIEATPNTALDHEAPRPAPVFRISPGARSFIPEEEEGS